MAGTSSQREPQAGPRREPTILFSTTLGWNPGDEVILAGIENLFSAKGLRYKKRIYNRNPASYQQSAHELLSGPRDIDYVVFAGSPEWYQEILVAE